MVKSSSSGSAAIPREVIDAVLNVVRDAPEGCSRQRDALAAFAATFDANAPALLLIEPLAFAAALRLDPENRRFPLGSFIPGVRPAVDDLADAALDLLAECAPEFPSADLRARVWDVIWTNRRRDRDAATSAIASYVEAAKRLAAEEQSVWDSPTSRFRRALSIAGGLKVADEIARLRDEVRAFVTSEEIRSSDRVAGAEILASWGSDDARTAAQVAESIAERTIALRGEGGFAWGIVRHALGVAATAFRKAGDVRSEGRLLERRANTFELHADWLAEKPQVSRMLIVELLRQAVRAHRDIGSPKVTVDRVHARLIREQAIAVDELRPYEGPAIDLSEGALQSIDAVRDKSFGDALLALVAFVGVPRRNAAFELARSSRRAAPLSFLMTHETLDGSGRRLALRNAEDDDAETVHAMEMLRLNQQVLARGAVDPARIQIASEHRGFVGDWMNFLSGRGLVSPDRVRCVATGLAAGFASDFITSTSVLVPQIEHMIRCIVAAEGGITSTLEFRDGIQREAALSTLLGRDELRRVLGEDRVFDLHTLLDGDGGANLRNRVAHGLLDDDDFYSGDAIYLWYSTLRLVVEVESNRRADPT